MRNELLEIAAHCRVMSDHTIDLSAAAEFRKLAERLETLSRQVDSTIERAAELSTAVVSQTKITG
jgi:hypothetical protein